MTTVATKSNARTAAANITPAGTRGIVAKGEVIESTQLKAGNIKATRMGTRLILQAVVNNPLGPSASQKSIMLAKTGSFQFTFDGQLFQMNVMCYEAPGLVRDYTKLTGSVSTTNGTVELKGNLITWDIDMTRRNGATKRGEGKNTSVASTVSKQQIAPGMWFQGDVYKIGLE